jgi:magnesium-transporting ATPase (P-type)
MRMKIFSWILAIVLCAVLVVAGTYKFGHWDTTAMSLIFNLAAVFCVHRLQTRYYTQTVTIRVFAPEKRRGFLFWVSVLVESVAVWFVLFSIGTGIAKVTDAYNTFVHEAVR